MKNSDYNKIISAWCENTINGAYKHTDMQQSSFLFMKVLKKVEGIT